MTSPRLAICVPTHNRAAALRQLLTCLDDELPDVGGIEVLISDNASTDETWALLTRATTRRPWLRIHRQTENLGAVGNLRWLIDNAPTVDYVWCFGDDDVILPGGLTLVAEALRAARPAWLFLPHTFVDAAGQAAGESPAPGDVQVFPDAGALYRAYHHWLTFLSASIVQRDAFREANATVVTDNAYIPLLWFFRAGLLGPCAVAAGHVVSGSTAVSWADRAHDILTLHFTSLFDDGLREGLSAEEFGETLDGLYAAHWSIAHWRRQPLERLLDVVRRFPQSRCLRDVLWRLAREQQRPDALGVLANAALVTGDRARAQALVEAGEARFAAGDPAAAVAPLEEAAATDPSLAAAWNDLAVVLHALGRRPHARAHVETALFVAPDDPDAQANHAALG